MFNVRCSVFSASVIVERMSKDLDAWIAFVIRSKTGEDYRK